MVDIADTVNETPDGATTSSVMRALDLLDARPPQDEYDREDDSPPAYDSFEEAYVQWRTDVKAKHAVVALDKDPGFISSEKCLREAKELLKELKAKSEEIFKASHPKRSTLGSIFKFKKSKSVFSRNKASRSESAIAIPGTDNALSANRSSMEVSRITSQSSNESVDDAFRLAHEAEVEQELVVRSLEEEIAEFKRKRERLENVASGAKLAWTRLRRIADEKLSNRPESADLSAAQEKLEYHEVIYELAMKKTKELTRARLAVQNSHVYFTSVLNICDSVHNSAVGRAVQGALGGGYIDLTRSFEYRAAVTQASKAQVCLNEVFRVMAPHERLIPENRMEDYKTLQSMGLMQSSKIYNLLFGGRVTDTGVGRSVKVMLGRQEAVYANLTNLAVWIQDYVPVCKEEEEAAMKSRDDARGEVAAFWEAGIKAIADGTS